LRQSHEQHTPPNVQAAAAIVNDWLAKNEGRLSDEQHAKLSAKEKLEYSRRFDQSKMPEWKDPRVK
jgi:hypothetical protein